MQSVGSFPPSEEMFKVLKASQSEFHLLLIQSVSLLSAVELMLLIHAVKPRHVSFPPTPVLIDQDTVELEFSLQR